MEISSSMKGNLVVLASCKWANLQHGQISAFRSRRRTAVLVASERTLARRLCSVADVQIISHGFCSVFVLRYNNSF